MTRLNYKPEIHTIGLSRLGFFRSGLGTYHINGATIRQIYSVKIYFLFSIQGNAHAGNATKQNTTTYEKYAHTQRTTLNASIIHPLVTNT